MEDNLKTNDGVNSLWPSYTSQHKFIPQKLIYLPCQEDKVITAEKTDESKKVSTRPDQVFRVPN